MIVKDFKVTKDYKIFKFREDNRTVKDSHVRKLAESIEEKNMLHLFPILVNVDLEVMDGQHRLKAAEYLGLPIWYRVSDEVESKDMLAINVSSLKWDTKDVLTHFLSLGYPEYIKLDCLMKREGINITTALAMGLGHSHKNYEAFRKGEYKFDDRLNEIDFKLYKETVDLVQRLRGNTTPFKSKRFSRALLNFSTREDFNRERWFRNLGKMITRFHPCLTEKEYEEMFSHIYYWGSKKKHLDDN